MRVKWTKNVSKMVIAWEMPLGTIGVRCNFYFYATLNFPKIYLLVMF
jgi:hypothetical protein